MLTASSKRKGVMEIQQTLPEHIPSLDGLRATAVILVVAGHAASYGPSTHSWLVFSALFLNPANGVEWFFIISGFLITTLLLREHQRNGRISLGRFYIRRSFRILPPFYALVLTVLALKYWGGLAVPNQRIWTAATFTYNMVPHPNWGSWWLGHSWSLCIEEQFYLCWPLIFASVGLERAKKVAVGLIFAAPIIRVALLLRFSRFPDQISGLLPSRMDGLMLGGVAALYWGSPMLRKLLNKLSPPVLWFLLLFAFVLSPLLKLYLGNFYWFSVGLSLECTCLLLILLFAVDRPRSKLGSVLNTRVFVFVGVMSYSIYLWQQLFLSRLNTTLTGVLGVNLLCVFLVALASYRLIETPALRLRKMIERKRTHQTVDGS